MKKDTFVIVWFLMVASFAIGLTAVSIGFLLNSYSAFAIGLIFMCMMPWIIVAFIVGLKKWI